MKKSIALALVTLCSIGGMQAGITYGSKKSGFVVEGGSLSADGMNVTDGSLRDEGGSITGSVTCSDGYIYIDDGSTHSVLRVDGTYDLDSSGAITLGTSNDVLRIESGSTPSTVTIANGVTARVEGHGDLGGNLSVGNGGTTDVDTVAELDLITPISSGLTFNPGIESGGGTGNKGTLKLLGDAALADGASITITDATGDKVDAVIDTNGNTFTFGGKDSSFDNTTAVLQWTSGSSDDGTASIDLAGKMTIGDGTTNARGWTFNSDAIVNAHGNELALNTSTGATLTVAASKSLYLTDVSVTGMQAGNISLGSSSTLITRDASLKDNSGNAHIFLHGESTISATTGDIANATVTWSTAPVVELLDDCILGSSGQWDLPYGASIIGNGHMIDMTSLSGKGLNFESDESGNDFYFTEFDDAVIEVSSVTYSDSSGNAIRVSGDHTGNDQGLAVITLAEGKTPFNEQVKFNSQIHLDLLSDVTLGAGVIWEFQENASISGDGMTLDIRGAGTGFDIPSGKTVTLRNMTLLIDGDTLSDRIAGRLDISDVQIVLTASSNWSNSTGGIDVNGPVTFTTRNYTFTPPSGTNNINNVTVWYDTVSYPNTNNIVKSSWTTVANNGRIAAMMKADLNTGDVYMSSSSADVSDANFLYPNDGNANGRYAHFDTSSAFTFDGHGRPLYMGDIDATAVEADQQLLKVEAANAVTLTHVILDGLRSKNFDSNGAANSTLFKMGDGVHIRLQKDDSIIGSAYSFVDGGGVATIILDLNGHRLDLNSQGLDVLFTNSSSNLTIKNGTLAGVSGTLLEGDNASHAGKITLQDVTVEVAGATSLSEGLYSIKGHTRFVVNGTTQRTVTFEDGCSGITIEGGATLTLGNGITFEYDDSSASNFNFASASSTLELIGAHITATQALTLDTGRLLVDHVPLLTGTGTFTLAASLDIHVLPNAQIQTSGSVTIL